MTPPLPTPNIEIVSGHREPFISYDATQMQDYGKACREAALEEAAKVAATTCHREATPFADGFNNAALNIEHVIRSLNEG